MEWEDGPDDDGGMPSSPLPPADDRLWRHPSELATHGITAIGPTRMGRSLLGVTVVASVAASALLVTGLLAVTVGLGSSLRDREPGVTTATASTTPAVAFSGRSDRGLAALSVLGSGGTRTGAAVGVDSDGTLVTSAALVRDSVSLTVTLDDGSRHAATVRGIDTESGLAVLSVAGAATRAARWASAARLQPGDRLRVRDGATGTDTIDVTVVELGYETTDADGETLHHLVMLDAPAWSVVEGSAVLDGSGRVVALAVLDPDGAVYAVPIDIARSAAVGVLADGTVRAALLDVSGDALPAADAAVLGVQGGARVNDIDRSGPAAVAGLRAGDVIVEVDGQPVLSFDCLVILIRAHQPGDALTITYLRDGAHATATVTLGERALKGTP